MNLWMPLNDLNFCKMSTVYGEGAVSAVCKEYNCKFCFDRSSRTIVPGFRFSDEDDLIMFYMRFG